MAIIHDADAIGLVSAMPGGPGVIAESEITSIIKIVPLPVATFLLTCKTQAHEIITQYKDINSTSIQLVDSVSTNV